MQTLENVIIMGAAGRDFHNFNVYFRDNPRYRVVCFTATQIPDIDGRRYPPELAGGLYPEGIPIVPDHRLADLIREHRVDLVAFSYSDVPHVEVMHKAAVVTAAGADFILIGASYTMLSASNAGRTHRRPFPARRRLRWPPSPTSSRFWLWPWAATP
jgi:predicted GTPase